MKTIQFLTLILLLLLTTQTIFAGRYYDSETGRWLSVDPIADNYPGWSPYNYVENNPLRNIDPDGNGPADIIISNPFFVQGFGVGFVNQIGNTISGTWDAVTNPVETIGGIVDAVANSDETIRVIAESAGQTWDDLNSADPSVAGNAAGEIAAGVAEAVVGTKGISKTISTTKKVINTSKKSGKVDGLIKQMNQHRKKLADYKSNPDAYDNKGFLKNATPKQRESIINGRIKKLEKQIKTFEKDIEKAGGN